MKKGFTLVELLAVIAILAILIIIALPNVLEMFNNAKRDSFITEARSVFKTAQQKYVTDGGTVTCYSNNNSSCDDLEMSGRSNLYYSLEFTSEGRVYHFEVYDDNYIIYYDEDEELNIEDINVDLISDSMPR